jgi:ABC-type multidrug transport system permease subunit
MNTFSQSERIIEIVKIALIGIIGVIEIPLVIGLYNQNTVGEIFGMIISIFILQPLAVAVGLGLGIHPVQVMFIMISFGISVILVLPRICDMFAERSEWLQKNLKKIETITQKSEMFRKYGMYTFIPFIWVPGVGLYGCVMIAWLFRWRGVRDERHSRRLDLARLLSC